MRTRKEVLTDLVCFKKDLLSIKNELSQYPFDSAVTIIIINRDQLCYILKQCVEGRISYKELENWANIVECRDDVGFEETEIKAIIFELANPEINGKITEDRLKQIIYNFENN